MSSVQQHIEPIRPGGGLRRLQRGELGPAGPSTPTCSYPQLMAQLQAEMERAAATDQTVAVMRVSFDPLPGTVADAARAQHLPEQVLDRVAEVASGIRIAVLSPGQAVAVVPAVARRADGESLATALVAALAEPLDLDGLAHHLSPRVGAAMFDQENTSIDDLTEGARLALNEADAGNPAVMFHPYQRVRLRRRTEKESALRAAVLGGDIHVEVQPAYELRRGTLVAFEAFARWTTAEGRPVPPVDFIPMAADLGLLHHLSRQVMAKAILAVGPSVRRADDPATTLWFNVTPDEVRHPLFGEAVGAAMEVDPNVRIGLELSPVPAAADNRDLYRIVTDLVARGARVAAGDFGIGPANLPTLEQLPFDSVKLQGALIRQIASHSGAADVVGGLIAIATSLEVEVTAQCVETEAQAKLLRDLGCDIGQGAHYAAPTADVNAVATTIIV